ncbi:MAG: SEC-C metal-binding domain-containing protein, partial [Planctomycetota bacterium]
WLYGERSHGAQGLLEDYKELFRVEDDISVLEFLRWLSNGDYDEHVMCPCESGMKLRKCHRRILKKARRHRRREEFKREYEWIMDYLGKVPV